MTATNLKQLRKKRRQARTRAKISGTSKVPRLNIAKSLNFVYLQLIDDQKKVTLASVHSKQLKKKGTKVEIANQAGLELAKAAADKKITTCVFDRGSSPYHGRVKAAAEGARTGGLKF
jgi:large subunit ribosomal protein L18